MAFKFVHHFIGEDGILREIKWLDIPDDTTKEQYQWQWIPFGYEPIILTFKTSTGNTIMFEEGSVNFDLEGCTFHYLNKSFQLKRYK